MTVIFIWPNGARVNATCVDLADAYDTIDATRKRNATIMEGATTRIGPRRDRVICTLVGEPPHTFILGNCAPSITHPGG